MKTLFSVQEQNIHSFFEQITIPGYGQRVRYVGRCASENAHLLDATSPISDGVVVDWDAMEDVWHHMYYEELLVPPDNFPVLHSEPVDNPPSCREKHIEVNSVLE